MRPRSWVQPLKRQLLKSIPCQRTVPLKYPSFARNPDVRWGCGGKGEGDVQRLTMQVPWEGTEPSIPRTGLSRVKGPAQCGPPSQMLQKTMELPSRQRTAQSLALVKYNQCALFQFPNDDQDILTYMCKDVCKPREGLSVRWAGNGGAESIRQGVSLKSHQPPLDQMKACLDLGSRISSLYIWGPKRKVCAQQWGMTLVINGI